MDDAYRALEEYKLISMGNFSVLLVWDRRNEEISPLKYQVYEFVREHFPAYVEIKNDDEALGVQGRCRNFVFTNEEYVTWGKANVTKGAKKINVRKLLPDNIKIPESDGEQKKQIINKLKKKLSYEGKWSLYRIEAGVKWRLKVVLRKIKK